MESLRVSILGPAPSSGALSGGASQHAQHLVRELRKRSDLEIEWLTSSRDSVLAPGAADLRPTIVRRSRLPGTLTAPWADSWRLARLVNPRSDLVHSLMHLPPYATAGLRAQGTRPLVVTVHTLMAQRVTRGARSLVHDRLWSVYERRALRRAAKTIVVSPHLAEPVEAIGGRIPAFIPNGVDPPWFGLRDDRSDPNALLCVGRVERVKGYHVLLEALSRIQTPYALRVIGGQYDSAYMRELRAFEVGHGLRNRIEWLGEVPQARLEAEMERASVFLLPSIEESMPIALLEAMAAGKATLASRVGGVPWILESDKFGTLVPPGDPVALASAIESVLSNGEKARRMGREARRRAAAFSWPEVARQTSDLYRGLAAGQTI